MEQFSIVSPVTRIALFCFTSLYDWFRKLAPLNQSDANLNQSRLERLRFPRLRQFDQFHFEFPSAFRGILPSSKSMAVVLALVLHSFTTLNRKMLSLFFKKKTSTWYVEVNVISLFAELFEREHCI